MCSGGKRKREEVRARNQQSRLDQEARRKQAELDRLAQQRVAVAQQQQERSSALQAQQSQQIAAQQAESALLQEQQVQRIAGIEGRAAASTAAAEKSKVESMAAGRAVASSLGVLSKAERAQGRTASVSKRGGKSRGSRQTTASLNIGATSSGSGSGSNLSI
jgi:hypothetical protein